MIDIIGWATIMSQFLAALSSVFKAANMGNIVSELIAFIIDPNVVFLCVVAYCAGMAIFTIIMGNVFASFAVMTTGIAVPLLITQHHGNPAVIGAIGMLAGYCGTLITPMAANFNIVPAALLEMRDKYGVIKAQIARAATLWVCNVILMYNFAF